MLVLASNSPRRKQLLALGGWDFSVLAAQVDEQVQPGELPGAYVLRLAEDKARAALRRLGSATPPDTLVVAADTTVTGPLVNEDPLQNSGLHRLDNPPQILGKPTDNAEAESMLGLLRGRTHQVFTGLAILRARDGKLLTEVCVTDVTMRDYSDAEMQDYIASGDPLDKAGAYAIQHPGFKPVESLHGCYANVMGLPVCYLARMLEAFDLSPGADFTEACQAALEYPCSIFRQVLAGSQ